VKARACFVRAAKKGSQNTGVSENPLRGGICKLGHCRSNHFHDMRNLLVAQ
jgi:hypothetical protein